jgi:membrane-bound metal-dependent hydrolase YbcI (DUF457 family)
MFIGHFGAGMMAKKIDSRPSLGTLFIAAQFIDLLWPLLIFFGVEKVQIEPGNTEFTPLNFVYYPFSHSLFGVAVWAILFGAVYFLFRKNLKSSIVIASLVLSHWFLDLLTHRPDLPLVPWLDFKVGLGLWNSIPFTIIVELSIFLLGAYFYFISTKAKNKIGSIALWSLLVFFIVVYFMNIFSPPPPTSRAIAYAGFSMWLFVAWAYWIDRNREIINSNN